MLIATIVVAVMLVGPAALFGGGLIVYTLDRMVVKRAAQSPGSGQAASPKSDHKT